jgi:hypothetical protein
MTRDDIIAMAREAKLPYEYDTGRILYLKELEHFAALIEERIHTNNKAKWYWEGYEAGEHGEREECAQLVENFAQAYAEPVWAFDLVKKIRERGGK